MGSEQSHNAERKLGRKPGSKTLFPNITQDARLLGVSRNWLYIVLSGRGKSEPLLRKFNALKAAQTHLNIRLGADPSDPSDAAPVPTTNPDPHNDKKNRNRARRVE